MHKQLAQNPTSPTVAALMLQAQLTPLVSWRICFELLTEEEISQPQFTHVFPGAVGGERLARLEILCWEPGRNGAGAERGVNERVLNRLHQVQRITKRLQQERRFLKKVLDSYGDDYRASQFTILLEDEGSQGTDAPTPGNAENEPPEKEGLSLPRRTPAPTEASSPAPGEGPSGWKRQQAQRVPQEGHQAGVPLTPELAPVQIKVEEDFGFKAVEALDSSWVSRGPDKLLPYPTPLTDPPINRPHALLGKKKLIETCL
ncbi:TCF3 fusion partner-like [Myotis lucifugus]|uniref:TCF3 fusion partner-like n=1 Tax=Myotis lucifugus TaxID=59463 RepID=UPI000CCBDAC6|nr:TCF3 fusion partner-like [Myotis lucifugus]